MRCSLLLALCVIVVFCGCASRPSVAGKAPPAIKPVAIGKSNRFEMIQNGRQMDARDFDAWMKARGIRIAKGPQVAKTGSQPKAVAKKRR